MKRHTVKQSTLIAFREALVGFVLREISDIFVGAGFPTEVRYEPWGSRRKLVDDYYQSIDLTDPENLGTLLSALGEVVRRLRADGDTDTVTDLLSAMIRSGYRYDGDAAFRPVLRTTSQGGANMAWSLSHYNLICYSNADRLELQTQTGVGSFPKERLFEHTSEDLTERYKLDLSALAELPTMIVAEADPGGEPEKPAVLARIHNIREIGDVIQYQFRHMQGEKFSSEEVFGSGLLDINVHGWEHSRRHWAVKNGNLIEILLTFLANRANVLKERVRDVGRPKIFSVKEWPLPTLNHVAVMMPFDSTFDKVYEAIRTACRELNLETRRVDEISGPTKITDDVFSSIVQSRFVIGDLSERNPNVLYEVGLAHGRNCEVIMITQNNADVPFDLDHIRFVRYLPNNEGLEQLRVDLIRSMQAVL